MSRREADQGARRATKVDKGVRRAASRGTPGAGGTLPAVDMGEAFGREVTTKLPAYAGRGPTTLKDVTMRNAGTNFVLQTSMRSEVNSFKMSYEYQKTQTSGL